jgi:deoxyribodipyrimidine photolyase-related protein
MSTSATLIFPHQLFQTHPAVQQNRPVYLIEETLYFNQYSFHKKKLVLHRASMKAYADELIKRGISVTYIDAQSPLCDVRLLIPHLQLDGIDTIHYADVTDYLLQRRMVRFARKVNIAVVQHTTPYFLNTFKEGNDFFSGKDKYFQTDFYIAQRKSMNLLLEKNGKPLGGKWSYDHENRLRFPKGEVVPLVALPKNNAHVTEAISYVEKFYPNNYGNTEPPFFKREGFYPTTHTEAQNWLDDFLKNRFQKFGAYEDAMVKEQGLLYHSAISPMMNTGLLTPQQVIDKVLDAAVEYNIPLNSLEGYIRQIVGWREYIHLVYEGANVRQRTRNYWGFTRKIPPSFWQGTTGIHPVDVVVQKVLTNGYSHHIERLMVMGNFMLLCEFNPDEVYKWFMEMYVDAYDWVMVPNTYGMTQFADGGLMMTKPYISGSNYLMKMGNWDKGPWQQAWDGLFWRFMHVHRSFFEQNPRLGMLLKLFDKMPEQKRQEHLNRAEEFLQSLDGK